MVDNPSWKYKPPPPPPHPQVRIWIALAVMLAAEMPLSNLLSLVPLNLGIFHLLGETGPPTNSAIGPATNSARLIGV